MKNTNTIIMDKEKTQIEKNAFLEIDDSEAYENNSNEIEDIADLENEINYAETSDESLSSISLLMKDITKYPLLSKEDEIEAFSALEAAKTSDEIKRIKEHIVNANYRLVFSIAKRYAKDDDIMDKFQTGCIGLMKAVDMFDYKKGYKFSTYATWWIRQAITRSMADTERLIRIPVYTVEILNKIRSTTAKLTTVLLREPTLKELSEETGIPINKIEEIMRSTTEPVSLDRPVKNDSENDDASLGDFISSDPNKIDNVPDKAAIIAERSKLIMEHLDMIPEREKDVIMRRFGLGEYTPMTLEEIGKQYGLTRERIRQIEAKAMRRLKLRMRNLYELIDV